MGGNIWSNAKRLNKEDYQSVCEVFANTGIRVIESYRTKSSFGDLDAVHSEQYEDLVQFMNSKFTVMDVSRNGTVTSFLVEAKPLVYFQIDLIYCPKEEIDFSYRYFSWNDCGNLIGRLARRVDLKFGHDGLWYIQRSNDHVLKEHLLIRDFDEALEYLDLNPLEHRAGFETPEDIFSFIISSKYFDYNSFELSQRNNVARTRDRKRVMYNKFLKWLNELNIDGRLQPLPDRSAYLTKHFEYFAGLKDACEKAQADYELKKQIAAKFNGRLVMELLPLKGRELGTFITHCKQQRWFDSILTLTQEQINDNILLEYESYRLKL